jgi:phosphatidylinositol alpha-1,6-mannosyltransferase
MPSLLVTNDFPPKVGGIQSYVYELWRRLPAEATTVLTTAYNGSDEFDAAQPFRIERTREHFLVPTRRLARDIDALAREVRADVVFLDPMLPLGAVGPWLGAAPYVIVAHGAEITVYGRLPGSARAARRVLRGAAGLIAAGTYPAQEAARILGRPLAGVVVPPGVDVVRFHPVPDPAERAGIRVRHGLDPDRPLVLGLSRLVPRKGFDALIWATTALDPSVQLVVGGAGRDQSRLVSLARRLGVDARVRFLGRVDEHALPDLYACADVFAMPCRDRWGGLEAEGFGIVFLEAAACGVAAVAGRSGGSHEAVVDGETGLVVEPRWLAVWDAIDRLLAEPQTRARMGQAARRRAQTQYSYDRIVDRLRPVAAGDFAAFAPVPPPQATVGSRP